MTNIVQRNLHRSLAKSIISVEEETGVSQDKLVKILNEEFGYVDKDDQTAVSNLENQMALDVAAEKHAAKHKVTVSELAVARTAIKRKMGTLANNVKVNDSETKMA
ncbi:hypothetical protein [Pectobacterium versatile]|jgi:hypothetical protein|uniref:hypothetical protein n=1 Tax=Pectobacterium versatile TaxID=2488639 RepID=UPI0019373EB6|nr:hypothetical protein [Pectobacterium versatile]QQK72114.1 hypothetical protein HG702_11875 [Pectobacterium versatile]